MRQKKISWAVVGIVWPESGPLERRDRPLSVFLQRDPAWAVLKGKMWDVLRKLPQSVGAQYAVSGETTGKRDGTKQICSCGCD